MPSWIQLKKMATKKTTRVGLGFLLVISFIFAFFWFNRQLPPQNTIRIAIDRPPTGLVEGQGLDVMAKRIAPLLAEYQVDPKQSDDARVVLAPRQPHRPMLHFEVIRDETTRAMAFIRGDVDILYNTLSLVKTEWMRRRLDAPRIYSRPGWTLSYLGFSLRHPVLQKLEVRQALIRALAIGDWIRFKFFNWVEPYTGITQLPFDPQASGDTLDQLGYPRKASGSRFDLKFYTTPAREGFETAFWIRESLSKIGVSVEVTLLDSVLYFQKMKKGESDLFLGRWFRFSENESIGDYLKTGATRNYFHYSNPKVDGRLDQNPVLTANELHSILEQDLPFFPLYIWKHGLIVGSRIRIPDEAATVAKLDETFRFLLDVTIK